LETTLRNRFPPPTFLKKLKLFFKKTGVNSARDCSKLVRVHSKDCGCTEGKRWPNTILIKRCAHCL
jgi:hypothetical protein